MPDRLPKVANAILVKRVVLVLLLVNCFITRKSVTYISLLN